jgi:hypothetical protein
MAYDMQRLRRCWEQPQFESVPVGRNIRDISTHIMFTRCYFVSVLEFVCGNDLVHQAKPSRRRKESLDTACGIRAGITSAALAGLGANNPFFQSCITYFLLWATGVEAVHKAGWQQPPWKYFVLALLDVSSTSCLVRAYNFTSITSVTLLDSWTVPCVMLLTAVLLKQRCVHHPLCWFVNFAA